MEGQLDFEVYGLILYLAFFVFIRFILSVAHSMKRQYHQLKVFYKFSSAYKVKPSTVIPEGVFSCAQDDGNRSPSIVILSEAPLRVVEESLCNS